MLSEVSPYTFFCRRQDDISFLFKLIGLLDPHSLMKVGSDTSHHFSEDILTFANTEGSNGSGFLALQKFSSFCVVRSKAATSTLFAL